MMPIGDPQDGFSYLTLMMDSYIRVGIDRMLVRVANLEEPDQIAAFGPFCLYLFGGQLMFEILEHLP